MIPVPYTQKNFCLFYLFFYLLIGNVYAQNVVANEPPFCRGERLEYQVYYSFIHAGTAIMSVDEELYEINEHPCYKIHVQGTSSSGLGLCGIKITDVWESYLDLNLLQPLRFITHIQENNYTRKERIDFDYQKNQARVEISENSYNKEPEVTYYPIPKTIKDLVSGYYALRDIDTKQLKLGDKLMLNVLHDQQIYDDITIVFLGRRTITTKLGKISSLVFAPMVPTNDSIFSGERPIEVFISDDANKIPLKLKVNLVVGAVDIELTSYKGLKEAIFFQKP
jgi:hypothetical protein